MVSLKTKPSIILTVVIIHEQDWWVIDINVFFFFVIILVRFLDRILFVNNYFYGMRTTDRLPVHLCISSTASGDCNGVLSNVVVVPIEGHIGRHTHQTAGPSVIGNLGCYRYSIAACRRIITETDLIDPKVRFPLSYSIHSRKRQHHYG